VIFTAKKWKIIHQTPTISSPLASRHGHTTNQRTLYKILFLFCFSLRVCVSISACAKETVSF